MNIKVHVQGWTVDHASKAGEEPNVMIRGILEIDGTLIEDVSKVEAVFTGGDFATVVCHLIPGRFEVVTHTNETWPELLNKIQGQKEAISGSGTLIAVEDDPS